MRWENAGVTNLNHIMDTVTKKFLTFEKIKTPFVRKKFFHSHNILYSLP
jgi:hypothetical protein